MAAHRLNLRGLVAAARDDDPSVVELDLRSAVAAFDGFGARTWAAQAVEDLGRWLLAQGRDEDARIELAEASAATRRSVPPGRRLD